MDDWLEQRLQAEAKKRILLWLIGGGFGVAAPILAIILIVIVAAIFLAGFGYWVSGLFTGAPPPMGMVTARSLEWLPAVDAHSHGLPNALGLAVIAQASGGEIYGDRYYCVQGSAEQSSGIRCLSAYGKGWHDLGKADGLTGVNQKDVTLPSSTSGNSPHAVAWNLGTGLSRLAQTLAMDPALKTALPAFHRTTQAPSGWMFSGYASTIRSDLQTYGGPQMAAWAIASWGKISGTYQDANGEKDWVLVAAGAPTGAPWTLEWKAPTVKYVTKIEPKRVKVTVKKKAKVLIPHSKPKRYHIVTKKMQKTETKTVTVTVREVVTHNLTGRQLEEPSAVYATLTNGQTQPLTFSASNANVPVWPGGSLWGGQFKLSQIAKITAVWPGVSETMPWPPVSGQAVGQVSSVPITNAVQHWWSDIQAASQKTGVPADWIAAEMMTESAGDPTAAVNGLSAAYGLMQLEPATAQGLPGYYPGARQNPAMNLLLGAELLAENYATTHSWRLTSAANYGGVGGMESDGYRPGMTWQQAAPLLNVVPDAWAGNSWTMTAYANRIEATSQQIAAAHP